MRILFFGDLVGDPGRAIFERQLPELKDLYRPHVIIVNGENSASDGRGLTPLHMEWYGKQGVDLVTSGNHIWAKKEIIEYIGKTKSLLRPANFPSECPGTGVTILTLPSGIKLGVINVLGRIFMRDLVDCPIRTIQSALTYIRSQTNCILIDIHAEASAEKSSVATYFDGKVSAVVGTHTHVQTADERILPGGTAFITDVGMGGALNPSIGMRSSIVVQQMLTQMPARFVVETEGPLLLSAVVIEIDEHTGRARTIERLRLLTASTT